MTTLTNTSTRMGCTTSFPVSSLSLSLSLTHSLSLSLIVSSSGNTAGRGPFGEQGYQYLGISAGSAYVKNWFLDCGFGVVSVHDKQLNFTFIDNHGTIRYQTTLENVFNAELISGVVLRGLGISPRAAGLLIFIPTLALAVSLIAFLSKDFWSPDSKEMDLHNQERVEREGGGGWEGPSTRQQGGGPSAGVRSRSRQQQDDLETAMDDSSGKWSSLDVSTDRLAPSRHGG
jgi:hypothetical protein